MYVKSVIFTVHILECVDLLNVLPVYVSSGRVTSSSVVHLNSEWMCAIIFFLDGFIPGTISPGINLRPFRRTATHNILFKIRLCFKMLRFVFYVRHSIR